MQPLGPQVMHLFKGVEVSSGQAIFEDDVLEGGGKHIPGTKWVMPLNSRGGDGVAGRATQPFGGIGDVAEGQFSVRAVEEVTAAFLVVIDGSDG